MKRGLNTSRMQKSLSFGQCIITFRCRHVPNARSLATHGRPACRALTARATRYMRQAAMLSLA